MLSSDDAKQQMFGGKFEVYHPGNKSAAVYGKITFPDSGLETYGGFFQDTSDNGAGVHGVATGVNGRALAGRAEGANGKAVDGWASATGAVTNYGGRFRADGDTGYGVYAKATSTADTENYGGYFEAAGKNGVGAYGRASGVSGRALGGKAEGASGRAVDGWASATGAVTNYGGRFRADGDTGYGVYAKATSNADTMNCGGYFEAVGKKGVGVYGEASGGAGFDNVVNYGGKFVANGGAGFGVYGNGHTGVKGCGTYVGVEGDGFNYDFYATGYGTNYGPFTGGHDVRLASDLPDDVRPGLIVVTTGRVEKREGRNGQPSWSSTLPTVTLARCPNDRAVFGVLVNIGPLPPNHWYRAAPGERFGIVNALGEGVVWVCDLNGEIHNGDYITTSALPGYGQRQDDDLLHSYTLGKATEEVDWETVEDFIEFNGRKVKIYPIAVVYTSG